MAIVLFYTLLWWLLFLAFVLLALTQFQHRRTTGAVELSPRRVCQIRSVSAMLLIIAMAVSIIHEGGGFGSLLWIGLMSLAACAVAMILAWWPGLFAPLALSMQGQFSFFTSSRPQPGSGERCGRYSE